MEVATTNEKKTYNRKKIIRKKRTIKQRVGHLEKIVKQEKPELKYLDTVSTGIAVDSSGTLILLNGCAQGDDINTREGREIRIKSLRIKWKPAINASATGTIVRCILFIDKQVNASAPSVTTILKNSGALNLAQMDLAYRKRFKILYDKYITMSNNSMEETVEDYFRKMNLVVEYNSSSAGTVADIVTNALYMLLISDQATNTPTVVYWNRVRFYDN